MRFNNRRGSFRTATSLLLKKNLYEKILMMTLGLNSDKAKQVFNIDKLYMNNRNVINVPRHKIISNCLICRKFNIDVKSVEDFRYCLGLSSYKLQHRINILKDIGVLELNISLVSKIISLLNKPVFKFKRLTNIPLEQNISKNIFNRLDEPHIDITQLKLHDELPVKEYYKTCLLYCKTRIFNLPYLDDKKLLDNGMKFKSISMIAETLRILKFDLNYNEEMIKKYPTVITAPAENINSLLNNFKDTDICGISIIELLRKYPYMLFEDASNIKELLLSFKRYEIPNEYIRKFVRILTIGNDIFVERMEEIKKHPDLYLWQKHPRILQLIVHKAMAYDRIGYLRLLNRIKWARCHTILAPKYDIEKFIQYGNSTVMSRKPLKYMFMNELGSDKGDLIKTLMRHQYWKTAGFADIAQMLKYLKANFTISEICHNIHIVLYARPTVEKLLTELREQYSQSTEFSFTNGQYLALCLYMLEKDNHFTGDGIWNNGHNAKQHSSHSLKNQIILDESSKET